MRNQLVIRAIFAALVGTIVTTSARAGDLNPPAGPVGPTMKTLAQVEPRTPISAATTPGDNSQPPSVFKITQPGSYYLTASFQVPVDRVGIVIACNDVTIDLGGFTIASGIGGVYAWPAAGPGATLSNVTVRNGAARGATSTAFGLQLVQNARLEGLTAIDCDWSIEGGEASIVNDCIAENNGEGISVGRNSVVRNCIARYNENLGFYLGDGTSATGCLASNNDNYGFILGNGSSITNSVAKDNGTVGIGALQECLIADCSVQDSGTDGITTGQGCIVRNCTAGESGRHGIAVIAGTTVQNCTARSNGEDGINATWQTRLVGNICISNGTAIAAGAGIRVTSWGSRIEENMCCGNDKGIIVSGTDNFIVKNTAKQSTTAMNFDVVAGNELAPVVTNPGTNTFSTATPWSNFGY